MTNLSSTPPCFVSARTMEEYVRMFALSSADLSLRILDCASGAASFTAEARAQGFNVWAVDPLYNMSTDDQTKLVELGYERAVQNIADDPTLYNWGFPASPREHSLLRRCAADAFLSHIANCKDYYIGGRLEKLPFTNESFDLVLCSHFLFTYSSFINEEMHLRCVDEMLRVTSRFIRIYPIVGFGADATSALTVVTDECNRRGLQWRIRDVSYHFFKSAGRMLEIEKT